MLANNHELFFKEMKGEGVFGKHVKRITTQCSSANAFFWHSQKQNETLTNPLAIHIEQARETKQMNRGLLR